MFTVVHAQISSTSRVLRSRWTGVSRGDCIFPFETIKFARSQTQVEPRLAEAAGTFMPVFGDMRILPYGRTAHHEFVRIGVWVPRWKFARRNPARAGQSIR